MVDVAQTTQNVFPAEPSLADLLTQHSRSLLLRLNCHHVGVIEEFDTATQRAKVSFAYKKTFLIRRPTGQYTTKLVDYPLLLDVPVLFLGNSASYITVPPEEGDECLLLFNDRDIDNWYNGDNITGPATSRLHSIADAFAFVGVRSVDNAIADFDAERIRIQRGTAAIGVGKDDLILVENDAQNLRELTTRFLSTVDALNTTITNLTTALTTMVMTGVTTGAGSSGPADLATQGSFTSALTELGQYTLDLTQLSSDVEELLE